jgi:hypothetical protein
MPRVRAALSRLALVTHVPGGLNLTATGGTGGLFFLPGLVLHFPTAWPEPVECPFEVVAVRIPDRSSWIVALRILAPAPDGSAETPVARARGRGRSARPVDLFRAEAVARFREQVWPTGAEALLARSASGRDGESDGGVPAKLAAELAGLVVDDVLRRPEHPGVARFLAAWFVTQENLDRARAEVDPSIRSWVTLLERLLEPPTPEDRSASPAVARLIDELRTIAGIDLDDPDQARQLKELLRTADAAGATARRAVDRVRTDWIELPGGFVTTEPRAARLGAEAWEPVFDLSILRRTIASVPEDRLPVLPTATTRSFPLLFLGLDSTDDPLLADPAWDPTRIAWAVPAELRVTSLADGPSAPPPVPEAPPSG